MSVPADPGGRYGETAVAGLIDVSYDIVDSPVGALLLAATDLGLCRISFDPIPDRDVAQSTRSPGARVLRPPRPLEQTRRELDEYFAGSRTEFEVDTDVRLLPAFQQLVLAELARVPYGRTTTYGELGARVGKPSAARAVGRALNRNPIPIVLPCHRVLGARGELIGYAGGLGRKEQLLALEGSML